MFNGICVAPCEDGMIRCGTTDCFDPTSTASACGVITEEMSHESLCASLIACSKDLICDHGVCAEQCKSGTQCGRNCCDADAQTCVKSSDGKHYICEDGVAAPADSDDI